MRATRSRTRAATNLLTSTPDEVALAIACRVLTARDLLCLIIACRRFRVKCIVASGGVRVPTAKDCPGNHGLASTTQGVVGQWCDVCGKKDLPVDSRLFGCRICNYDVCESCHRQGGAAAAASAAAPEMLSLAEEAARRWLAGCSEQERGWVPRRGLESWLGLMHEVGVLRLPLVFGRSAELVSLSEGGARATHMIVPGSAGYGRVAASRVVMRSGRHYVQFTLGNDSHGVDLGVIRPGFDLEGTDRSACEASGSCFYGVGGECVYTDAYEEDGATGSYRWLGMQDMAAGDRIGLLLDLTERAQEGQQGTMTVFKNGEKMGVMVTDAAGNQASAGPELIGPLCWAVDLMGSNDSVRIESLAAPPAPTADELQRARDYYWEDDDQV